MYFCFKLLELVLDRAMRNTHTCILIQVVELIYQYEHLINFMVR